jgi:rod shape-determining protein MreC
VHDKQVRRRRAVLAALVAVSLILLTAYFGSPQSSPLHSIQRGIDEVLSPIQEGASKVLSPVRDVAGWFSSTLHAKTKAEQLQKDVNNLTAELAQVQRKAIAYNQLAKLENVDQTTSLNAYQKLSASVIDHDAQLWYAQIEVDKGSDDGVTNGSPVIGDGALVGDVTEVGATYSFVTLITDHTFAAAAQIQDQNGDTGLLEPAVGNPNQLILADLPQFSPGQSVPSVGQLVVTAGFKDGPLQDLYPAGIPIGTVSNASDSDLYSASPQVQISPAADLRHLETVQVLIKANPGNARAQLP